MRRFTLSWFSIAYVCIMISDYTHGQLRVNVLFLFSDTERCQLAFVTFKDAQGAETAVLLSVILSLSLSLSLIP